MLFLQQKQLLPPQRQVRQRREPLPFRLRRHRMKATTLQVTIRDPNFKDLCRQRPLPAPTCTARELMRAALEIIGCGGEADAPIRAITLTAQNLIPEDEATEQLGLFAPEEPHRRDKAEKLERVVDRLRERYGHDAVTPAVLVPAPGTEENDVPF